MAQTNVSMAARRLNDQVSVLDIQGEVNGFAEAMLMDAYNQANNPPTCVILLNFTDLAYMNSSGIGLLVTLLIRANRQKQRLIAYGLSDHYRQIFELTRLNEAIQIYPDEQQAFAAAQALG